ncbi:type VI secretion system baseplate subunit TssE [Niveibacterium sp. 24ML]|uniref:type VI secretion system baseplate subunit TssE n=1 Tax=Niveibacterium sp. 24ML TaxID=2985512 RepID=UPI0022701201|nr:type VI secretion system baseplate subunit TssE [Niveibacterium sp. 24ML]MCX9156616.1 type VI secretion system baseplate subunit TssE [Niveibacterium sp. 24ML]
MVELTPLDRLQPALLDRLTDDEPSVQVETRERRVLTKSQLRAAVLRDLGWIMNATRLAATEDLSAYPEVERSVINFGLPAFSGETASTLDVGDLERAIREAILRFEPRILAETLNVEAITQDSVLNWHNVVSVKISAQLWAQPVPLELLLRTEVDLETGQVELADANA